MRILESRHEPHMSEDTGDLYKSIHTQRSYWVPFCLLWRSAERHTTVPRQRIPTVNFSFGSSSLVAMGSVLYFLKGDGHRRYGRDGQQVAGNLIGTHGTQR